MLSTSSQQQAAYATAPPTGTGSGEAITFSNANIWIDAKRRSTAITVKNGTVIAHGAQAEEYGSRSGTIVDMDGACMIPAFSDGHCHPIFGGMESMGPSISDLQSVDAIVAEVSRWAASHGEATWITGASYDPSLVPSGRFDARWLDAAVPDRPCYLRAHDYHSLWCNTAALNIAGITADTPDPELGSIDRRDDGSPLGTLREWHAVDLVMSKAPQTGQDTLARALAVACRAQNRRGITWMQDAWVDEGMHLPYLELLRNDSLTVRSNLAQRADPAFWMDQTEGFLNVRSDVTQTAADLKRSDMLSARTIKFFADGVVESGTGAMLEPYAASSDCGMEVWKREHLIRAVTHFDALGFQTHIHAIGDRAVRNALDAIEAAIRKNPPWDRRPVITHCQVIQPSDIPRFAALGVIANVEAYWAQMDPLMVELTAPRLAERTELQYPFASLEASGARLSHGSDWPVSSNDPLLAISTATTRQTASGEPSGGWLPKERLAMRSAMGMALEGAAYQGWTDGFRGNLNIGSHADLAMLNADPEHASSDALAGIAVTQTWLKGARVC
ncbi:amidohydrolase [Bifidobacterium psychraerophilum]|uniref:amidohydrolase n=1 Tax=Bifidobacterium psychraerophilum TaxID=218140 RepID=UPI00310D9D96